MNYTVKGRVRQAAVAAASAAALLFASGCGYTNLQATTIEYAAADGVKGEVGPIKVADMLVLAEEADAPGRILGAAFNSSDQDVELTMIGSEGAEASITVPANGEYYINNDAPPVIIEPAGAAPGALTWITFETSGASEEFNVPVLDGTFERYETLMPTPGA